MCAIMRRKPGMGMRGEKWLRWELERISNRIEFIGEGKGVTSQSLPLWLLQRKAAKA